MKILRSIAVSVLLFVGISANAQILRVSQFPGKDVATKQANAQAQCVGGSVKCILVIEPELGNYAAGTPAPLCSTCSLLDYRNGAPGGTGPVPPTVQPYNSAAKVCGDSITYGTDNNGPSNPYIWPQQVASIFGWYTLTNGAQAGHRILDPGFSDCTFAVTVTATTVTAGLYGFNDQTHSGNNATYIADYKDHLISLLVWQGLPNANIVLGKNETQTGTWSSYAPGIFGLAPFVLTQAQNSTGCVTVTGSVVGVALIISTGNTNAAFQLGVDGVYGSTITPAASTLYSQLGVANQLRTYVKTGLTDAAHTVCVKDVDANASNALAPLYFWGNHQAFTAYNAATALAGSVASGPYAYVGNTIRATANYYATYGGSDAGVTAYNAAIQSAVQTVQGWGLTGVTYVDASSLYDPTVRYNLSYTEQHPNAIGHSWITRAFAGRSLIQVQ
jgi:hypothetical protein